jgi:hypothetical protein
MKMLRLSLLVALTLTLSACACRRIRDGVVVSKRAHKGLAFDPIQSGPFMRFAQPDVYWVKVVGKNDNGHLIHKNIAVFRNDWSRISVGDHWNAQDGFEKGGGCCAANPHK